jgi:hypothetical protein
MSRRTNQLWIQDADKILADGEWHDGWAWLQAVEKKILPSVAARHHEDTRTGQAARRHGVPREEAPERVKSLSLEAQIAAGKRDMTRAFVTDRVRLGAYEVDPWPMPDGGWKQGGWNIRFIQRYTPNSLVKRYHVSNQTIRELILADPPLPFRNVGSGRMQITDAQLPELDRRVEEYRLASRESRRQGARARWSQWRAEDQPFISATNLAERSHLTHVTVTRLLTEHPELGAVVSGRVRRLPKASLDAWDKVVTEYLAGPAGRRSMSALAAFATRRDRYPQGC